MDHFLGIKFNFLDKDGEPRGEHTSISIEAPLTELVAIESMAILELAPVDLVIVDLTLTDPTSIEPTSTDPSTGAEPSSTVADPNEKVKN